MIRRPHPPVTSEPQPRQPRRPRATGERLELLNHVQAILEPWMIGLGIIFLVLLLLDYSGLMADRAQGLWLSRSLTAIWGIFLVDFSVRFLIAPRKRAFLATNWLSALSLALPFLRPFRALRAVRAMRSISLVRLLGGVNRAMRLLRRVAGGHELAYLGGLTLFIVLAGAVGIWFFERAVPDASVTSFGDALWWSSALVTTINNEQYAVSPEGRVLAILMRVYAVSVFGFITATFASYLIGRGAVDTDDAHVASLETRAQIADVLREIALLREMLVRDAAPLSERMGGREQSGDRGGFGQGSGERREFP